MLCNTKGGDNPYLGHSLVDERVELVIALTIHPIALNIHTACCVIQKAVTTLTPATNSLTSGRSLSTVAEATTPSSISSFARDSSCAGV